VVDYIKKHGIFVLDAAAAWIDEKRTEKRLFHAIGDGRFIADGEKISHRKIMAAKVPEVFSTARKIPKTHLRAFQELAK
jgi:hypothetical protein